MTDEDHHTNGGTVLEHNSFHHIAQQAYKVILNRSSSAGRDASGDAAGAALTDAR